MVKEKNNILEYDLMNLTYIQLIILFSKSLFFLILRFFLSIGKLIKLLFEKISEYRNNKNGKRKK